MFSITLGGGAFRCYGKFHNFFLAAKRSSTSALFSLSVRPSVSKLNFSLFGQLMTTYDNL